MTAPPSLLVEDLERAEVPGAEAAGLAGHPHPAQFPADDVGVVDHKPRICTSTSGCIDSTVATATRRR